MEAEERSCSIGSYVRQFEEIENALQCISEDINNQLSKPGGNDVKNAKSDVGAEKDPDSKEKDVDFNILLSCSDEEFDERLKMLKKVDLDMAIIIFEQQIQMANDMNEGSADKTGNLFQLRMRLTKLFMIKTEILNRRSSAQKLEGNIRDSRSISKSSRDERMSSFSAYDDVGFLSYAELQALLFYNGITHDEDASKDDLVALVKTGILDIDDGELEEWVPPEDNEMQWKTPTSTDEAKSCNIVDQTNDPRTAHTSNDIEKQDSVGGSKDVTEPTGAAENESINVESNAQDSTLPEEDSLRTVSEAPQPPSEGAAPPMASAKSKSKSEEGTVVSWDPTALLKDLFFALKRPEPISLKKDRDDTRTEDLQPKLEGYLEKLPVNQTKATLLKGWKKRYFRICRGKLQYFMDQFEATPLGSILLTGSELRAIGDKELQIAAQNNGNILTVRCSSTNETNDWYRAIKRQTLISTPVTTPVKVSSLLESPPSNFIIIDLGASTIKGGFASEDKPRVVFPAVYAVKIDSKGGRKFTESGLPDPSMCTSGFDAFKPEIRKNSKLVFPLRPTLKVDKFAVKTRYIPGFIDKVLKDLNVEPEHSTIILSLQRHFTDRDKEIIFDHLFGHLDVSAVYAQQQALLALYSYKDTTGIIVDIGDHIDVLPVLDGVIIENGSSSMPQGGQLVTENMARLMSEGGYRFFSEVESYIVKHIKEKTAYVSLDYESELEAQMESEDVDMQKYNLPGKERSITVSSERFRCAEGLFDPNKWGNDYEGIHKLVQKAIKQSGIDQRKEMCRKIFLSGGTTLMKGFKERLAKELKPLVPDSTTITVHASENRALAAFAGASVIAEQPTFSANLVSKEDWLEHGLDIFKRMAQS